jgi:long-subunit fatty acid transport protein
MVLRTGDAMRLRFDFVRVCGFVGRAVTLMLLLGALAVPAFAQSGQTAQIPLQFDFLNPGARSLALGSAFIAVADDATAAFTNPAGLTFLVKPEVSAEIRFRHLETPYLSGGRLSGTVSNTPPDTISGPAYSTSTDSAVRPYFLSVVYPWSRWTVSVYRHELVLQKNDFLSSGAFEASSFAGITVNNGRQLALQGSRDISIDNYGGAVAYRFSDAVSAGVGVSVYRLDLTANFGSFGHVGSVFGAIDFNQPGSKTTQNGDGTKAGVNLGLLWTVDPKVRVGAVFRQGVALSFTQVDTVPSVPTTTRTGDFQTPYVVGIGGRFLPRNNWSFSVDYDYVAYSRLKQDYVSFQVPAASQSRIDVSNGNELHVGTEYVLTNVAHTPAVRGGIWFDPDHTVHYASDGSGSQDDVQLKAIFPGGDSVVHYCFGLGVPVSPEFEFNVGADLAKQRQYVSASFVARFGK